MEPVIRAKFVQSQIAVRVPYRRRDIGKSSHRLTAEQVQEIIALRKAGQKLVNIGKMYGYSKQRIAQIVGPSDNYRTRDIVRAEPSIGTADHQSKDELSRRDLAAKAEELRFQTALRNAIPDGTKCLQKGCCFPAVYEGECRQHAMDRRAPASLMPSILPLTMEFSSNG